MPKIYNLTDTWNDGATVFDAIKIDVTDTSSAAGSKLIDLQVGGASKFKVDKDGNLTASGDITGLDQVDNTSDVDKPVSTAQATAIGVVQTDVNNHEALTDNPHAVTAAQVGLGAVDNTSDVNKPVSVLQQAAIDAAAGGGAFDADANTLITASTPIVLDAATDEAALTLGYTTNKASGNDTGLLINQTDTASPGTSNLLDLQVGGASKFSVSNTGVPIVPTTKAYAFEPAGSYSVGLYNPIPYAAAIQMVSTGPGTGAGAYRGFEFELTGPTLSFGKSSYDIKLTRDAANTLGQRNGINAQTYNIYNTYTSDTDHERAHIGWNDTNDTFVIGTEAAGTGIVRDVEIKSKTAFSVAINGIRNFRINGTAIYPNSASALDLGIATTRPWRDAYLSGTLDIAQGTLTDDAQALNITSTWNDAADTFTLIKADVTDTASAAGSKLLDLQVGGASKFSVSNNGELGINGVTPPAQEAHIADATNATDVITRVNAILVALENIGITAAA